MVTEAEGFKKKKKKTISEGLKDSKKIFIRLKKGEP